MFSIICVCLKAGGYTDSLKSDSYDKYVDDIIKKEDFIITDGETAKRLKDRQTVSISPEDNFDDILQNTCKISGNNYIFVTGQSWLVKKAAINAKLECLYQSIIDIDDETIKCEQEFPIFQLKQFVKSSTFIYEKNLTIDNNKYHNLCIENVKWNKIVFNDFEQSYFNILYDVSVYGTIKHNRTSIKTVSKWGQHLEIDLSQGFPLLTTKFVPFKGLVNEMLFFLSGKTDTTFGVDTSGKTKNEISNNVTKIWFDNTTREFLDSRGLTEYKQGEAGPIYGFQWRHYGANYVPNRQLSIGEEGIDQIQYVIDGIKALKQNASDPRGRRLIVSSWNPSDLDKMCLPPCHYSFQFSVENDKLNCLVNMRSSDLFLGLPWNMNYALLVHMIAHITDLIPGKLVFNLADAHIYSNCLDQIKIQMKRNFRKLPRLEITRKHSSIDDFSTDSFKLVDYNPHPPLYAQMAI